MTVRVYLMPIVVAPRGRFAAARLPKYLDLVHGRRCTMLEYGAEESCLFVVDATNQQHDAMATRIDVSPFPANLDSQVTAGNRAAIVSALERFSIPAQWIANGMTFRIVLRRVSGIFGLSCNVRGRGLRFLQANLDAQIAALPAGVRASMAEAAKALNLSMAGIGVTDTVRQFLGVIGEQFDARPLLACRTSI